MLLLLMLVELISLLQEMLVLLRLLVDRGGAAEAIVVCQGEEAVRDLLIHLLAIDFVGEHLRHVRFERIQGVLADQGDRALTGLELIRVALDGDVVVLAQ